MLAQVEPSCKRARQDGGLHGLHIFLDCATKLLVAAFIRERKAEGTQAVEDIYSMAAKLFRDDTMHHAINIEQTTIAATCSKFAAACSTRAYRLRAQRASGVVPSGSGKLQVSEPVKKLIDELRAKSANGAELTLRGAEVARVDQSLTLLMEISNAMEGYDFGRSLGRAAAADPIPDWLREGLPALDNFVSMESKDLLKQAEVLRDLVKRLADETPA